MALGSPPPPNLPNPPPSSHRPLTHNPKPSTNNNSSPIVTVHAAPKPQQQEQKENMFSSANKPPPPPDPTAYSFPSLLSSLGASASEPLDAMAEICGKSKMSLADQYGSHLAPVEERKVHKTEGGETGLVQRVFEWLRGSGGRGKEGRIIEAEEEERENRRFTEEPASIGGG